MADGISAISTEFSNALYLATTAKLMSALTAATRRQLAEYNIDITEITSEEEAQAVIEKKKEEKLKVNSEKNSETYYDKQIMADAIDLAEDLGIYVGSGMNIETLMDDIKNRLNQFTALASGNDNLKKIVDEYSNRYDYLYSQYMNKKGFLANQIITSLDAMSIASV